MVELLALKELRKYEIPPEHSSVSEALRAVRQSMRHWHERAARGGSLNECLANATKDDYQRKSTKEARYKPRFKDKPANGKPDVATATAKQKKKRPRKRRSSTNRSLHC